jgi:hypothetical protein
MTKFLPSGMMCLHMPLSLKKFFPFIFWIILLGVFAFRFVHLPNAPFLNDEPRLLVAVEKSFAENVWPKIGPTGSQPIPYGPIPHWFYQLVRNFSPALEAAHWAHAFTFFFASILSILIAAVSLGATPALFFGFLIASSPYLFMYSQMPWEVLLLVPGSALVAFSWIAFFHAEKKIQMIQAGTIAGLGLAICLGTHLMSASIGVSFFLFWLWNTYISDQKKNSLIFFLSMAAVFFLCISPYLLGIWNFLQNETISNRDANPLMGNGRQLWWSFLKTPMQIGIWQMKGFFEPEENLFFSSLGSFSQKFFYLDPFGWVAKALVWASVAGVGLAIWKKQESPPLIKFACLGIFIHIGFLQILNLATYPHYFLPFWWAPFLLLSQWSKFSWGKIFLSLFILGNFFYLFHFVKFVDQHKGTRGDYYGTTFQQQKIAFELICEYPNNPLRIDLSAVRLQTHSAQFFLKKIENCKGRPVEISKVPMQGEKIFLRYGEGARIELEILR